MKISIDEKLVNRNKLITQISLYAAIALIVIGLYLTFSNQDQSNTKVIISYLVLLPAYALMQINVFMANKWGHDPRVDQIISNSFKGLDNHYSLFHYTTPVSHLLVGPAGIWIIKPYHQHGIISYDEKKKKYTQEKGGNILSRFFAMDNLSDIEGESKRQILNLKKYFSKIGIKDYPDPLIANVFYRPDTKIQAKNAPEITIDIDKLKDLIRQTAKKSPINDEKLNRLFAKLPEAIRY
jgi:hypothetical protein